METNTKPFGHRVLGAAAAVLVLLLTLPMTGWIARSQVRMLVSPPSETRLLLRDLGVRELPGIELRAPATTAPERGSGRDYRSQLAYALEFTPSNSGARNDWTATRKAQLQRLRDLADRFPSRRAALFATVLRYSTLGLVAVRRDSEVEAYYSGRAAQHPGTGQDSSAAVLATFDQDARMGGRLDPDNAYFPLMRAIGLFAGHRDAEGLEVVRRAGAKPRFEDYALDEPEAMIARLEATYGKMGVALHEAIYAATLLPHYAQMRAAARFVAYKAAQMEAAGNVEAGIAMRHAMMRCGVLMRTQAHSGVEALVGIAIFAIQTNRPGGAATLSSAAWKALSNEEAAKKRLEIYAAYLTRLKHPAEAAWVRNEGAAGIEARDILDGAHERSPMEVSAMSRMLDLWVISMVLLANGLEMLLMCGAMLALKALRRDMGGLPIRVAASLSALFILLAWRWEWAPEMGAVAQVLANLTSEGATSLPSAATGHVAAAQIFAAPIIGRIIVACLSLCVPFLTVSTLALAGLIHRERERPLLVTALSGSVTVLSMGLILLYAAAVSAVAREEAVQTQALGRMVRNDGEYLAELSGKRWPP